MTQTKPGYLLEVGQGATLKVVAEWRRGAILLLEWGRFSALIPAGMDFESMDSLMQDQNLGSVTALLLAEGDYASLNARE